MIKKVAHVIRRLTQKEWGGVETTVLSIAQMLERSGIQSPIFTTNMFEKTGPEMIGGALVKRFPFSLPWFGLTQDERTALLKKGGNPLSLSLFWNLLFEKDLSLIHIHALHRLGGIGRTVARMRGIPYVVTLHSGLYTLPESERMGLPKQFPHKTEWGSAFSTLFGAEKTVDDAAAIIAVGKDEYDTCMTHFPEKKVFYLPDGIDLKAFSGGDVVKQKMILCVSRIDPQKNQLLLVRAYQKFLLEFPQYRLVFVGPVSDVVYFNELKRTINEFGLHDVVTIIPGLPHNSKELLQLYKEADFFVLPSIHEPFGIVILEAWASQTPVIASRVGGIIGFTSNYQNILLFATEDDLLAHMRRLATNDALKQTIITNALTEVQKYSWDVIVPSLIAIYNEL